MFLIDVDIPETDCAACTKLASMWMISHWHRVINEPNIVPMQNKDLSSNKKGSFSLLRCGTAVVVKAELFCSQNSETQLHYFKLKLKNAMLGIFFLRNIH